MKTNKHIAAVREALKHYSAKETKGIINKEPIGTLAKEALTHLEEIEKELDAPTVEEK